MVGKTQIINADTKQFIENHCNIIYTQRTSQSLHAEKDKERFRYNYPESYQFREGGILRESLECHFLDRKTNKHYRKEWHGNFNEEIIPNPSPTLYDEEYFITDKVTSQLIKWANQMINISK